MDEETKPIPGVAGNKTIDSMKDDLWKTNFDIEVRIQSRIERKRTKAKFKYLFAEAMRRQGFWK